MVLVIETKAEILLRVMRYVVVYLVDDDEPIAGWWQGLVLLVAASILGTIALVYCFAYIVHHPHVEKD